MAVIVLAAILLVFGIFKIKKVSAVNQTAANTSAPHPVNPASGAGSNPGSIPDGIGTNKGNGGAAMSSGMQG